MSHFERNLLQTATYWAPLGNDLFGKTTYDSPVTVACRWEDRAEMVLDKMGKEITTKSRVFLAQDLDIDGYLMLGTSVETDPLLIAEASEIRQITRTPNLRNLKTLYTVHL